MNEMEKSYPNSMIAQTEEFKIILIRECLEGMSRIYAVDVNSNKLWETELTSKSDTFVGFKIVRDKVVCKTWNGFELKLNIFTGNLESRKFTK